MHIKLQIATVLEMLSSEQNSVMLQGMKTVFHESGHGNIRMVIQFKAA